MAVELIPFPRRFDFDLTVRSHGWFDLEPFRLDRSARTLDVALARPGLSPVTATIGCAERGRLRVEWTGGGDLAPPRAALRRIFRLDEDLRPFHRLVASDPDRRWIANRGAGRLLRAPTAFEDLVKLVLTTNCSWALTRRMVANLVALRGEPAPKGLRTFPGPDRLAGDGAAFFRDRVKAGYRAPFLAEIVRRVNDGRLDPESWRASTEPSDALRARILECPGAGPYVAENLLKLLGRYDYLALDSWCRARYAKLHLRGRKPRDAAIERRYRRFGEWKGLVLWLDLTRHWHEAPGDAYWS